LRARPALGVSVGEQQSHYCDAKQNKTDRAHGSSPSPSFRAANAKGEAASKPMNARRCISTTPLKDYAEYSRSAPCIAAKADTLDVRFGADVNRSPANVRFTPQSGHAVASLGMSALSALCCGFYWSLQHCS